MVKIHLEPSLLEASQNRLHLGVIQGQVRVEASSQALRQRLEEAAASALEQFQLESLAKIPQLAALRDTYKALGKKPQKYRGSSEALLRRIIRGLGLYYVNNVVEINNLLSLHCKRSIGSYDLSCIQGAVSFGIGKEDEPYIGIGRGQLNIAKLPVFRDELGAFGSPTSDSERTRIRASTQKIFQVIIGFDGPTGLQEQLSFSTELLEVFANARDLQTQIISP